MTTIEHRTVPAAPTEPGLKGSRLWLWFVVAFGLQAAAWTAWFTLAAKNKVQEVPLETPATTAAAASDTR